MSATPLQLVRDIYDGFARRDVEALLSAIDDDIVITQDPALPWGGRYVGRDAALEFFGALITHVDTAVTIEGLFAAGDDVVQYGRSRGTVRATGVPIDVAECHIWTIRDGRAVEARFYIDSDATLAALAAPGATS